MARKTEIQRPTLFRQTSSARVIARQRRTLILPRLIDEAARRLVGMKEAKERARLAIARWVAIEQAGELEGKEGSLDAEFLGAVFGHALGYRLRGAQTGRYDLEREFSVPGIGSADGAIGGFPLSGDEQPVALIELKAAGTDLDHDRSNGRTPVQQLWDYLNAVPRCPWGILSNFTEIRLYHRERTQLAYEAFDLRDLDSNAQLLDRFSCLLERGGLLPTPISKTPRAIELLRRSGERQREVGDELYENYRQNRARLIHHLCVEREKPINAALNIAQRLIDRIVFIAFCEDRGLLPPRIIEKAWSDVPPFAKATNPKWRNFVRLFRAIDKGHPHVKLETGYNGGLFARDPDVDDLELDDDWTNFFYAIGQYDFRDEVNVDVLGHLFEKSIYEIERMRAGGLFAVKSVEEDAKAAREPAMKKSPQRKRAGVYYTPLALTSLLVENALGEQIKERLADLARRHDIDPEQGPRTGSHGAEAKKHMGYWREAFDAIRTIRVCDPACGSGAFLIRAYDALEERYMEAVNRLDALGDAEARQLADSIPNVILSDNLFGVDLSPEAVEITQLALWIRSARPNRTLKDLSRNIVSGNSLIDDPEVDPRALRWEEAFPDVLGPRVPAKRRGFDCVIGNPPWERMKLQEREFFAFAAPEIAGATSAAARRRLIAALERKNPELHARYLDAKAEADAQLAYARRCGRYPLTAKGDVNTYMLFAELARSIVAPTGRVSLLTPSGIATDKTTREFFGALMREERLAYLYDFENRKALFPDVHRSQKFCALGFGGSERTFEAADFVFFAHAVEQLADPKRHIPLTAADMALMNPNTRTCPVFRRREDADLTRKVYRRVPVLVHKRRGVEGNPWGARFFTMFHQTNDAEHFLDATQLRAKKAKREGPVWRKGKTTFLPLYEAKMVQAYDHRAASVVVADENWVRQGQTEPTSDVQHQDAAFSPEPRWWVDAKEVAERLPCDPKPAYLCFKDVTSPTNERTMIAAFIPYVGVVNSAPLVLLDKVIGWQRTCCLLANFNVFALDFVARQKVGGVHLNFFIVEQLPILPPHAYDEACPWQPGETLGNWIAERVLKLTCTSEDMVPLAKAAGFAGSRGDGVQRWSPQERADLTAELDAAYLLLYGLSRADAEHALSTFPVATRRPEGAIGSSIGERVLEAYDALSGG